MRVLTFLCLLAIFSFAEEAFDLETVSQVDLRRYAGKWYEIARLPNREQENCVLSTVEYCLRPDGLYKAVNRCQKHDGRIEKNKGLARLFKSLSGYKFKLNFSSGVVRLFGIGWSDYWVLELGKNYEYLVIGELQKKNLWVLARSPKMSEALLDQIGRRLERAGFDLEPLIITGNLTDAL